MPASRTLRPEVIGLPKKGRHPYVMHRVKPVLQSVVVSYASSPNVLIRSTAANLCQESVTPPETRWFAW